ncbi:ribonucleotide reductase [Earliella scabrosa]|nr:ribonucleotide reductase [Earliella scabrosa]
MSAAIESTQPTSLLPVVVKRNGYVGLVSVKTTSIHTNLTAFIDSAALQPFNAIKMRRCLEIMSWNLNLAFVDIDGLVTRIQRGLPVQISASELQLHAAMTVAGLSSHHPDYSVLASRLCVANLHKSTIKSFTRWVATYSDSARLDPELVFVVREHGRELENAIVHARDFDFQYSSIQTLLHSYLLRVRDDIVERPQYMYMRTAITIHGGNIPAVLETYDALSKQLYTPASPVLFNAGTRYKNFASCFLYQPDCESLYSRLGSARDLDRFWVCDGGIGMSLGGVPCKRETPERQPGVLPLMKVYDSHAAYCIAGRDRRPSALTVYLPMWHGDVVEFIRCRTSRAGEGTRMRHVFPGLWIPNVFMERLRNEGQWYIFDPVDVPQLHYSYGEEFETAYNAYVLAGKAVGKISAAQIWQYVCDAQTESGTPFILFHENVNFRNNQQHLGTVVSSNLCTEIVQYSSPGDTAVCTLASVALPRFVRDRASFDFDAFHKLVKLVVRNTDLLLDAGNYPTDESFCGVNNTRAIAIGVQGLADVFKALRLPFDSHEARMLNIRIFEALYHAALDASCQLAEENGVYPDYEGSPASTGTLYIDMWPPVGHREYDFDALRERISTHGLRNSMLTAQMPTASTAYVLGNSPGVDPSPSNIVTHQVLSGDYTEICPWLVRDLTSRALWSEELRLEIMRNHGSVQNIAAVPEDLRAIYRTGWEIEPFVIVDMAGDRAPFIDQSQSMSLTIDRPSTALLTRMQFRAWERGLKTGVYYLRTRAPVYPLPYGVEDDVDASSDDSDGPPPLEPAESEDINQPNCAACSG